MKRKSSNLVNSGRSCMTLFPPWKPDSWIRVDDSVRGGASKSYLEHWNSPKDYANVAIIFRGHLDTTVLGGAGFASQKIQYSTPLDLRCGSKTAGLKLSIRPQDRITGMPSDFVITLKTQPPIPPSQPKPRSQLTYEAMFVAPLPSYDLSMDGEKNVLVTTAKHKVVSVVLPFNSFTPTFRGRIVPPESPQWKKMNLSQVYELGIMCRSEFGKQQGDFALVLEKIEVVTVKTSPGLHWKQYILSDAVTAIGRLEGLLWAKLTDLLCCNGHTLGRGEEAKR